MRDYSHEKKYKIDRACLDVHCGQEGCGCALRGTADLTEAADSLVQASLFLPVVERAWLVSLDSRKCSGFAFEDNVIFLTTRRIGVAFPRRLRLAGPTHSGGPSHR